MRTTTGRCLASFTTTFATFASSPTGTIAAAPATAFRKTTRSASPHRPTCRPKPHSGPYRYRPHPTQRLAAAKVPHRVHRLVLGSNTLIMNATCTQ